MHGHLRGVVAAAVGVVLLSALPRAITQVPKGIGGYRQQVKEIQAACEAERTKLGLTQPQARKKYPTPEVDFPPSSDITADRAQDIEWKGRFRAGTRFVFDSDDLQVVKETLTPTAYTATVRFTPTFDPRTVIRLLALNPVSCETFGGAAFRAPGGRYQWDMTATNGWQLKMKPIDPWGSPKAFIGYQLEFYRPGEAKPFQVLDTGMLYQEGVYTGRLAFYGGDPDGTRDQIKEVQEQLKDTSLGAEEKKDLNEQLADLKKQLEKELSLGRLEVECGDFQITRQPGGTYAIDISCPESRIGTLKGAGSIKFLGV